MHGVLQISNGGFYGCGRTVEGAWIIEADYTRGAGARGARSGRRTLQRGSEIPQSNLYRGLVGDESSLCAGEAVDGLHSLCEGSQGGGSSVPTGTAWLGAEHSRRDRNDYQLPVALTTRSEACWSSSAKVYHR
ncbi:uncharacterized protein LAESUDRAFT_332574 [Laetiporus sulphureus 93-53]|uniref:Uncharacterized protein n=1 Tax=Laetiporus sulphureus 93-53 TaxID=1314785 RepID=A0A165CXY5_9APHY|nr:uncharacterized protein LAESUDRAFT_332574 [Laetiporus sulphureus 93-53]KZT03707.1 hypothetical protein LAESUDRAFT_332574 [Laetiporus sulphureus 93-53]